MRYDLRHETEYSYSATATLEHCSCHLRPRPAPHQQCLEHRLDIRPAPISLHERLDYFGNPVSFFNLEGPHDRLVVSAVSRVEVNHRPAFPLTDSRPWDTLRHDLRRDVSTDGLMAYQFTFDSPLAGGLPELHGYAARSFTPGRPIFDASRELAHRIHADFKFDPRTTDVTTPVAQVFRQRSGVCQDFAHLLIAALRTLGLPARYVSGYLRTEPPPGRPRLLGADASHAWVAVYCPDRGWLDLDPTNDCLVQTDHVTVAWGRDYADISPVKGLIFGGGQHRVDVRVDMIPESEARPAASHPMSSAQSQSPTP